jgi:hypothetical protein
MLLAIILSTSGAKARKSSNRCSWLSFCRLLEPRPESLQIDAPGYHFVDFWCRGQKFFKSMLLAIILSTSGAKARKSSNRWSWLSFFDFCCQGQKVFKSMLLEIIFSTSGAKARKSSNQYSWLSFCRLLEPMPKSLQINAPGYHFVDFWCQGQKVFKSMLLAIILSTLGAKARKSSNRCSWLSFCRLLVPRPESLQIDAPGHHFVVFWGQG